MNDAEIYKAIGRRLRARRRLLGLTQSQVDRACGTTFQQVQKYESGLASFSVSRLLRLSQALQIPAVSLLEPFQTALAPMRVVAPSTTTLTPPAPALRRQAGPR